MYFERKDLCFLLHAQTSANDSIATLSNGFTLKERTCHEMSLGWQTKELSEFTTARIVELRDKIRPV